LSVEYLITGATGLLGNNLLRLLGDHQRAARVLVRPTSDLRSLEGLDVEIHRGELTDAAAIRQAVDGVRYVIHAAADLHIGWRNWQRQRTANVLGTQVIATACREADCRLIHVSTVDTLPAAPHREAPVDETTVGPAKVPCTYVVTKREAEQVVQQEKEKGLDAVTVHPGFMLGPWDWKPSSGRMLLGVARGQSPAAPTGGLSGCDARDVATAILACCSPATPSRRYILAGENMTFLEAWRLFAQIAGTRPPRFRMGPLVRWAVGYGGDAWGWLRGRESDVNSAMIRMSSLGHYYSSARAARELGYHSRPFADSARDAWEWFSAYHYR
jgi:dihydroflavonol-4-reductase